MATLELLTLAAQISRDLLAGYDEYLAACEQDHRRGHRAHYCEHGTDRWTDWDNICGPCEDGITMADGLIRRQWALAEARQTLARRSQRLIDRYSADEVARMAGIACGSDCSGCGELLVTEADFYRHFVPSTNWSRNLGECPTKVR